MGKGSENAGGPEGDSVPGEFFRAPSPARPAEVRSQSGASWYGPALRPSITLGTLARVRRVPAEIPNLAWREGFPGSAGKSGPPNQRAAAAGKAVATGNLFDGWRRGRFGVDGSEVGSFRGSLRQDNLRVPYVPRLVGDRGPDPERIGRPRIPAFGTHQIAAANWHLPPLFAPRPGIPGPAFSGRDARPSLPTGSRHAAAPAIRLEAPARVEPNQR